MDSSLLQCTVKLLEALREDHRKYLEIQSKTSLRFDLFVGILFELVESLISFVRYCQTIVKDTHCFERT